MSGAHLLVAEPPEFFAWATRFFECGYRADPASPINTSIRNRVSWETMADMWNAWYGVEFEEGLQGD